MLIHNGLVGNLVHCIKWLLALKIMNE